MAGTCRWAGGPARRACWWSQCRLDGAPGLHNRHRATRIRPCAHCVEGAPPKIPHCTSVTQSARAPQLHAYVVLDALVAILLLRSMAWPTASFLRSRGAWLKAGLNNSKEKHHWKPYIPIDPLIPLAQEAQKRETGRRAAAVGSACSGAAGQASAAAHV